LCGETRKILRLKLGDRLTGKRAIDIGYQLMEAKLNQENCH